MAVVWQDPIITWGAADRYLYTDWNRIVYDAAWLLEAIEYEDYNEHDFLEAWLATSTDFLTYTKWNLMRMVLIMINSRLGISASALTVPGDTVTAYDFNAMEMLLLRAKNKLDQRVAMQFTNDGLYSGDPEIYAR